MKLLYFTVLVVRYWTHHTFAIPPGNIVLSKSKGTEIIIHGDSEMYNACFFPQKIGEDDLLVILAYLRGLI